MSLFQFIADNKLVLSLISVALIAAVSVLVMIERKIAQKNAIPQERKTDIEEEVEKMLKQKTVNEETLSLIAHLAREYFEKNYQLPQGSDYVEMSEYLKKADKKKAAELVDKIIEYSYSGEQIDSYKSAILLSGLKKIIQEDKQGTPKESSKIEMVFSKLKTNKEAPQEKQPEQKEEPEELLLQDVRNLKPIVIHPEKLDVEYPKRNLVSTKDTLDNLQRIESAIKGRKSNLI